MRKWLSFVLACSSGGCGLFQQVELTPLATAAERPSNVAAYLAVTDSGKPLTELSESNFRVYEDEQLLPAERTQLTLLDPLAGATHHVLLLLDMSTASTKPARTLAAQAALGFIEKVSKQQSVSVYAFTGDDRIVPVGEIARGATPKALPALEGFASRDASRNLNGAVVQALGKLDEQLASGGRIVKHGTLVVFSSGPDMAGRVDKSALYAALAESPHDVLAVGIGEHAKDLERLGRRGVVQSQSAETLPIAFEEAADKALAELGKFYFVSYCSPARAGTRRLRLEVTYVNREGDTQKGDFETDFDAKGFGPGCSPKSPPELALYAEPGPETKPRLAPKTEGQPSTRPQTSAPADPSDDAPVAPPDQSGYAP